MKSIHTRLKHALLPVIILIVGIMLFTQPKVKIPWMDQAANTYFSEAIVKAGVTYGSLRALNAVIAPIRSSDLQVQPAGLGITIAVGNVLDPLYQMVEQASDVMMLSITSLGAQKVLYELSLILAPPIIGICLILIILDKLRWIRKILPKSSFLWKIIIITFAFRLCLPISGIISQGLENVYFDSQLNETHEQLVRDTPPHEAIEVIELSESDGLINSIKGKIQIVGNKAGALAKSMKELAGKADGVITNLLRMMGLYVALLLIQVVVLPIGTFWLILKLLGRLNDKSFTDIASLKELIHQHS